MRFTTSGGLTRHKRKHTDQKRFKCDVVGCDFASIRKDSLTTHQYTHTNTKRFHCDVVGCSFACSQNSNLTSHKRRHANIKPFPCEECDMRFTTSGNCRRHEKYHEKSKSYTVVCPYDSFATTKGEGLACAKRFLHTRALDYHIQASHTTDGLQKRLKSEERMAEWFESKDIKYDRDFANIVNHAKCHGLKKYFKGQYSRPDFHLCNLQMSNAIVLVGNDEFAHRRYSCEADRMLKISSAIAACKEFHNVPIIYIRFNPHFYEIDGVMFDPPLEIRYTELAKIIRKIEAGEFEPCNPTGLNVVYMYYPEKDGEVSCLTVDVPEENQEFVMVIKPCVCLPKNSL